MIQFAQYRNLSFGYSLYVTGDCHQLGQWDPCSSIRMTYQEKDTWIANVDFQEVEKVKFKYFTAKTENPHADIKWDEGENRSLNLTKVEQFDSLNIMTFNIRYDCGEEGDRNWNKRKYLVCQTIEQVKPDILGCQEVLIHQKQFLEEQLENYNLIWRGREINFWDGEGSPILYNVLKFDLLFAEVFWLSDTPQVAGSKTYGNFIPRICTYARLQNKQNHVIINVFCTHFDHEHSISQVKSAVQIKNRINDNEQVIVMGDLNCLPLSEPVKILQKHMVPLENTMGVLDIPMATMHNWYGLKLGIHIDYIFVRNITWKKTKILNQQINGCYASDHFAKVAECEYQY